MTRKRMITAGVDTHQRTHHAAALDRSGRLLGDRQFPATAAGYTQLVAWLRGLGTIDKVGVEGTGSYGAGLARHLSAVKVSVIEVDRPDRRSRRAKGKSDPLDAIAAARAVQAGTATGTPKARTGAVEAIRVLRLARRGAVKARTAALNQFHALVTTAPEPVRADLHGLTSTAQLHHCQTMTTNTDRLHDPVEATKSALTTLATRITALTAEITTADKQLAPIVTTAAPRTSALFGVGPDVAGQLLTTAGDNPDRLRNEAAFAHLCGTAPIPASSGTTHRHRLNRGGDRNANQALYTIVLTRLRHEPRTHTYVQRRTQQGLSKKEIIRCLKRYAAREVFTALLADYTALNT